MTKANDPILEEGGQVMKLMKQRGFVVAAVACVVVAWWAGPTWGEPLAEAQRGDWPMWGGSPDRNMVSGERGIPTKWDAKSKTNIKWVAPLGSQVYGNPVVADGRVFVGTNNAGELRPNIKGDKGVMVAVDEKTGKFLWQATHDKLPSGRVNDWPLQGICSSPIVEGNRVYYVSNQCQVVCADAEGFLDGENDGPYKDEKYHEKHDADFIWVLNMFDDLEVFPHNLATSSPVIGGDLLFVGTSNGVDEQHLNMPMPDAPSFLALNKMTGEVVWTAKPEHRTLHGGVSSPAHGGSGGVPQVIFPGGDGWCYSFEATTGKKLWKFDMNPKDSVWQLGGRGTRNSIISTPVIQDKKVYLAVGQDPEHGEGPGHLYCIDATKRGDVTDTGNVWHVDGENFHRTISSVAIADGLLYASDLSGFLYCFDAATGKLHWKHDTMSAIWGSPYVVDGKVMIGTEDGEVIVLKHHPKEEVLATNDMLNSVYTTPVAANGMLFVANRRALFAIGK